MSEAVAALIVGHCLIDVAKSARAVKHALLKEQDSGVAHGVAPFVGDDAGDEGAGNEREADVFGVEAGTDNDGGRESFVFMERVSRVAATAGHEAVLAGGQIREREAAAGRSQVSLSVVKGGDRSDGDFCAFKWLAGDRVRDDSTDAIGGERRGAKARAVGN